MIKICKMIASILLTISILTIVIVLLITQKNGTLNLNKQTHTVETNQYMLGVCEDKVAVYKNGELMEIFDVYVNTLPEIDRKALKDGIIIKDKNELKEKIEDFTS